MLMSATVVRITRVCRYRRMSAMGGRRTFRLDQDRRHNSDEQEFDEPPGGMARGHERVDFDEEGVRDEQWYRRDEPDHHREPESARQVDGAQRAGERHERDGRQQTQDLRAADPQALASPCPPDFWVSLIAAVK